LTDQSNIATFPQIRGDQTMTFTPARAICRISLVLFAGLGFHAAQAQASAPAINVSEICTTCQDVIRCTRDQGSPVPPYPLVVYYLHPHTTWEQIVTIWEYLIRFGKPKQQDTRELTVYEFTDPDGAPATVRGQQSAELDAVTLTIALPGARIDRATGAWWAGSGLAAQRAGSCRLLPPADGFAFLRSNPPGNPE
jgi:hypothetical protein